MEEGPVFSRTGNASDDDDDVKARTSGLVDQPLSVHDTTACRNFGFSGGGDVVGGSSPWVFLRLAWVCWSTRHAFLTTTGRGLHISLSF